MAEQSRVPSVPGAEMTEYLRVSGVPKAEITVVVGGTGTLTTFAGFDRKLLSNERHQSSALYSTASWAVLLPCWCPVLNYDARIIVMWNVEA